MTIKEALKWGHETLLITSDSARLDAEVLLAHVLKKPITFLLAHDEQKICSSFGSAQDDKFGFARNDKFRPLFFPLWRYKRLIHKRKKGIPVAYLIGHKEFFFLDFVINRHVLVPRPDTETLVDCVISYLKSEIRIFEIRKNSKSKISNSKQIRNVILLDVGTGSGCIPISVCKNADGLKAIATDVSRRALKTAQQNVKKHKLKSRITLIRSDLLKKVPSDLFKGHEVIVTANLPYIPIDFQVSPELKYEPSVSLYGGGDGMHVYRRLAEQLKEIKPRAIFFELFESQIAIIKTKLPDYKLKYVKDMSGEARVLAMEIK